MANFIKPVSFGGDDAAKMEIERSKALAQALGGQAMQPLENQMSGGWAVPIHPLQGFAKLAQAGVSGMASNRAQDLARGLGEQQQQRRGADMSLLAQALQGRQASPGGLSEDASGNVTQMDPMGAMTPQQSLTQALPMLQDPQMQQIGMQALMSAQQREDAQRFQAGQAEENRAARAAERQMALEAASQNAALQRQERTERGRESDTLRRDLQQNQQTFAAQQGDLNRAAAEAARQQKNTPKLPPAALQMQQELMDEIGTAESITADLAALDGQLATGELQIGPIRNIVNSARNTAGMSSPESQNFNSFKTTLERLRNDSLRLNKGVQTEGDAQRAWNELMGSINDPDVVRKRLGEIQGINQRAAQLKRMQIEQIRSNFGLENIDTAGMAQPSPVGGDRRQNPRGNKTRVVNY